MHQPHFHGKEATHDPGQPAGPGGHLHLLPMFGLSPFALVLPAGWPAGPMGAGGAGPLRSLPHRVHPSHLERVIGAIIEHLGGVTNRFDVEVAMETDPSQWLRIVGIRRPADAQGNVPLEGYTEDISSRRRESEGLIEAVGRLAALLDALPDALVVTRNGKMLQANPAALSMFRLGRADGLPRLVERVLADDQMEVARHLGDAAEGAPPNPCRCRLQAEPQPVSVELCSRRILLPDGSAVLTVLRDDSERRDALDSAGRAERMASVGVLAAGITHEINNPLGFLSMNLDLMRRMLTDLAAARGAREGDAMTELLTCLEDAEVGARRIGAIVRDLRTFSRVQVDQTLIDPSEAVRLAVDLCRPQVRHGLVLAYDAVPLPPIRGDVGRLSQVVINLVLNAAQTLKDADRTDGHITVETAVEGDRVRIDVGDDGPGIPQEIRDRIFEPFFTTRAVGAGTGLGLAICHTIVAGMGGEITAHDLPGGGAMFRVELPAAEGEGRASERAGPQTTPPLEAAARPKQILIVDDEAAMRRVLVRQLRGAFQVVEAADGREAQRHLEAGLTPDIILCDVMMPGLDGEELYRWICRHRGELRDKVILVTGGAVTERARAFLAEVQNLVLEKPFEMARLGELLTTLAASPPGRRPAPAVPPAPRTAVDQRERRRAPRVPAAHIGGILDTGDQIARVRLVDASTCGVRLQAGRVAPESLVRPRLRLHLQNERVDELVTIEVRFVRATTAEDQEYCFEVLPAGAAPDRWQEWLA